MENFVIVWTIDGETMSIPHPTQDQALTITRKTLDSRARTCAEMFTPRVESYGRKLVTAIRR
jgi:hypothetical protein